MDKIEQKIDHNKMIRDRRNSTLIDSLEVYHETFGRELLSLQAENLYKWIREDNE